MHYTRGVVERGGAMVLKWSPQARKRRKEIYDFYQAVNPQAAKSILEDINSEALRLTRFPEMAAREPALEGLSRIYRSLVVRHFLKIVYFFEKEKDEVVVVTIWDCRRNPDKLTNEIEIIQ